MFLAYAMATAHAGQSAPVTDLEGDWDLTCTRAEVSVHLGLAGMIGGVPGSIDGSFVLPIDCDPTEAELLNLNKNVLRSCRNGGFDYGTCKKLALDVHNLVVDLAEQTSPVAFSLDVNEHEPVGVLFGLYPALGTATWASGAQETWSYAVDNNNGTRGQYGTLGIGVELEVDSTLGLGCLAAGLGTAFGTIDPVAGAATWNLDAGATLICAADLGGGSWLGGDVAIALNVDTESW